MRIHYFTYCQSLDFRQVSLNRLTSKQIKTITSVLNTLKCTKIHKSTLKYIKKLNSRPRKFCLGRTSFALKIPAMLHILSGNWQDIFVVIADRIFEYFTETLTKFLLYICCIIHLKVGLQMWNSESSSIVSTWTSYRRHWDTKYCFNLI